MDVLKQGTLWHAVVETTERARASGALLPVPTDHAYIDDGGVRFFVRVMAGLRRKAEARREQDEAERAGKKANPFLPPEKDLTVAGISETHVAVLNKFNVVDHHLLIVTREFEDQETLLTPADLEALWRCMAEYDSLGFYNGGAAGGASQRHKHLQVVPLPIAPEGPPVPTGPLLGRAVIDGQGIGLVPGFRFRHAMVRLPTDLWRSPVDAARRTWDAYGRMLERVGMTPPSPSDLTYQSLPYCLLVTREWMLLVPRSQEHFEEISLNSLAYAGSLFVWNEQLLERLRSSGPMHALAAVSLPQ